MVLFPKRLGIRTINEINEMICGVESGFKDKNKYDDHDHQCGPGDEKKLGGDAPTHHHGDGLRTIHLYNRNFFYT
jgi:hypothetical protein